MKEKMPAITPQQWSVITHGVGRDEKIVYAKPLLVLAGAGTGKTETLASFVAYRVKLGVDPSRILVLTFNRSAATEMERRIRRVVSTQGRERRAHCGTFHATGLSFI